MTKPNMSQRAERYKKALIGEEKASRTCMLMVKEVLTLAIPTCSKCREVQESINKMWVQDGKHTKQKQTE